MIFALSPIALLGMSTNNMFILGLIAFCAVIMLSCVVEGLRGSQAVSRPLGPRRPPCTDEMFISLLPPEVPPEVGLKVRAVLVDTLGVDPEEIYPDSRLVADLGAD